VSFKTNYVLHLNFKLFIANTNNTFKISRKQIGILLVSTVAMHLLFYMSNEDKCANTTKQRLGKWTEIDSWTLTLNNPYAKNIFNFIFKKCQLLYKKNNLPQTHTGFHKQHLGQSMPHHQLWSLASDQLLRNKHEWRGSHSP